MIFLRRDADHVIHSAAVSPGSLRHIKAYWSAGE